jgi:release factor glutamine methyltransferase
MLFSNSSKILFNQISSEIAAVYEENEAKSIVFLLLEHFLNLSKTEILLDKKIEQAFDFQDIINRLKAQEPVQYIIGETEFYGRKFKVTPDTLIPRPETEELVQLVLKEAPSAPEGGTFDMKLYSKSHLTVPPSGAEGAIILDIGTGSGCIAISLACEIPNAQVYAYDISEKALDVAQENAVRNNTSVIFEKINILNIALSSHPTYSVIVSNPPYVMNAEKSEMEQNVLDYEPHLALFVEDSDPLIFYKAIVVFASKNLIDKGLCVVEINQALGLETAELFWNQGFHSVEVVKDMFGKDRMVKAVL